MKYLLLILMFLCNVSYALEHRYPISDEEQQNKDIGSIFGENSLTIPLKRNTNTILAWDAAFDFLSQMPINTANKSEGIIITDWFNTSVEQHVNYKILVRIKDKKNFDLTVYKRNFKGGIWVDSQTPPEIYQHFKQEILKRLEK